MAILRDSFLGSVTALTSLVIIFSTIDASGQYHGTEVEPPVQIFPWGSIDSLDQFAATNTRNVVVTLVQGTNVLSQGGYFNASFSNVTEVMAAFQEAITFNVNRMLSNSVFNPNAPIRIFGSGINSFYPPNLGSGTFLMPMNPYPTFSMVNSNGTWVLPDLTGILPVPTYPLMVFYVLGLLWGRIEVYSADDLTEPILVTDSRYQASPEATNTVNVSKQAITIATAYLTSGNSGPYRLKVSLLTKNGFFIVDGNGMLIQERPLGLQASVQDATFSTTVTGGDPGRVFALEETTDLVTWSRVPGTYTVGTNTDWSGTTTQPTNGTAGFFRIATINMVPQ